MAKLLWLVAMVVVVDAAEEHRQGDNNTLNWSKVTCSRDFIREAIEIQDKAGCGEPKEVLIPIYVHDAEIELNFTRIGGNTMWIWVKRCQGSCYWSFRYNSTCLPSKTVYRDIPIRTYYTKGEKNRTCVRYRVEEHVSCRCCYPGEKCDETILTIEQAWNETMARTEGETHLTTDSSFMSTQQLTPELLSNSSISETEGESQLTTPGS